MHPDWELLADALYTTSAHTCVPAFIEDKWIIFVLRKIAEQPSGNTGLQCNIAATLCKVVKDSRMVGDDSSQVGDLPVGTGESAAVTLTLYRALQV